MQNERLYLLLTQFYRPPLTKALWKTKEGFRRENQRIDALMKKYEEKSSYVVVDETKKSDTKQKSRLFKLQNKQFTSGNLQKMRVVFRFLE